MQPYTIEEAGWIAGAATPAAPLRAVRVETVLAPGEPVPEVVARQGDTRLWLLANELVDLAFRLFSPIRSVAELTEAAKRAR